MYYDKDLRQYIGNSEDALLHGEKLKTALLREGCGWLDPGNVLAYCPGGVFRFLFQLRYYLKVDSLTNGSFISVEMGSTLPPMI